MCTFNGYVLESSFLEIQNIALSYSEHILKVSCHDLLMCTFKGYVVKSKFLEIQNISLPYREHIMKVSGHSIKKDL